MLSDCDRCVVFTERSFGILCNFETRDKNAVPVKNERAYKEEHAEHDHVHPTQNEVKICQRKQLQVEGVGSTDAKR